MYDDEVSWTTCTWSALMAQRISVALHMATAWEIARELSLAGAEDEAALFGGGVGRRLRCLNSHRTWRVCALAPFECGGVSWG